MIPTLPQNSNDDSKRQAKLAEARGNYEWNYSYPKEMATLKDVPHSDEFTPKYVLKISEGNLELLANHAALDFGGLTDEIHKVLHMDILKAFTTMSGSELRKRGFGVHKDLEDKIPSKWPCDSKDFKHFYKLISAPPIVNALDGDSQQRDRIFAWQRLAGANPTILKAVTEKLPDTFPVTDAHYKRAMGSHDSLEAALEEGRLFSCEYSILKDIPTATWNKGAYRKFLFTPLSLYAISKPLGDEAPSFMPVAIQCDLTPGPDTPIFTPGDGEKWELAKAVVGVAEGTCHEMVAHLGHTHMIIESVAIAAHRQLASIHPIMVLLMPHFDYTLALNDYACRNLIAPGGSVEKVLGGTLEGSLEVMKRGVAAFRFDQASPEKDFEKRGVGTGSMLSEYPFRDDALLLWPAMKRWVQDYLKIYYENDEAVSGDGELQAFVKEIGAQDGGRIPGVPSVQTMEDLAEFVTTIIWTASAQHSAVNFAQFPFMSYAPNIAGAGYTPAPGAGDLEADALAKFLPPLNFAENQFTITFQLSSLHMSRLGKYPWLHFKDHRVWSPLKEYKNKLESVESTIGTREQSRLLPYPFLMPSQVLQSISI